MLQCKSLPLYNMIDTQLSEAIDYGVLAFNFIRQGFNRNIFHQTNDTLNNGSLVFDTRL